MSHDPAAAVLVCAIEGTTLSPEEKSFFREIQPAGVTLFSRNIPTPYTQVRQLVNELQSLRGPGRPPMLIAIDQEGGRVARIKSTHAGGSAAFPDRGPALALEGGRSDDAALSVITSYGAHVGNALAKLGVNINFAPCCDVLSNSDNQAIGDRAFSKDANGAAIRAQAFLTGLQSAGVRGCLKHFPGQGHASADTHTTGTSIDLSLTDLEARELIPFRHMLHDVDLVMLSHCIYPQLAPQEASRSPWIIRELLRKRLGFKGVVVSDDMNMGAIPQDEQSWEAALIETIAAGADLLLVCEHLERFVRAHAALTQAAKRSPAFAVRLSSAADHVYDLRRRLSRVD